MIFTFKIVFGWALFLTNPAIYLLNILVVLVIGSVYYYFKDKLYKLNSNKTLHINNIFKEKELYTELHNEYQQIFESLEEAIVVVKNDKISFTNDMFHEIFENDIRSNTNVPNQSQKHEFEIDIKIFKVFRDEFKNEFASPRSSGKSKKKKNRTASFKMSQESHGQLYSIRDLVRKPASFFVDKFFFIDCPRFSK